MIDAQAVSTQLEQLGDLPSQAHNAEKPAGVAWLEQALAGVALQHERDAAGNLWVTLRGGKEQSVLLGSYLEAGLGSDALDSHLGLVAGVETMKALAHRYGGKAPCTVQLVAWAMPKGEVADQSGPGAYLPFPPEVAAYLELHVEPGSHAAGLAPLGVGADLEGASTGFHPRLAALCDEAVREMTGTSGSIPLQLSPIAAEVARAAIPTAAMYVHAESGEGSKEQPREKRLHLLQAAEAYGRWAEATMHLVGGDGVDLWAREHRVPRS